MDFMDRDIFVSMGEIVFLLVLQLSIHLETLSLSGSLTLEECFEEPYFPDPLAAPDQHSAPAPC